MSTTRFRIWLAILAGISLLFVAWRSLPALLAEHDGWGIIADVEVEANPLITDPEDILTSSDRDAIEQVVLEARRYGIPWSVAVVRDSTFDPSISPEDRAQRIFESASIESAPDADDGLLMAVVIPVDDHTETSVHFVTGENFYPKGGITPDRLQWIVDVQMAPLIANNTIGDAIIEGATWVEWMQLFEPKPDPPATMLQEGLRNLLHPIGTAALAGLALLVALMAAGVTILTRKGASGADGVSLDGVRAAALAKGRVDRQITSGMLLDAVDRGVLVDSGRSLDIAPEPPALSRGTDDSLRATVDQLRLSTTDVEPGLLARYLGSSEAKRRLEDTLARAGFLHPRSLVFHLALRIMAGIGLFFGVIAVVLAVFGEIATTLAVAALLTALSLVVLIWNEHRHWTTSAGRAALADWLDSHRSGDDRERVTYETIIRLEDVRSRGVSESPAPATGRALARAARYQP